LESFLINWIIRKEEAKGASNPDVAATPTAAPPTRKAKEKKEEVEGKGDNLSYPPQNIF